MRLSRFSPCRLMPGLAVGLCLAAGQGVAQTSRCVDSGYSVAFAALTATGATPSYDTWCQAAAVVVPTQHTVQLTVTGSPSTCTAHLEGTAKAAADNPQSADFADLSGAIDCTAVTTFHVTNKPIRTIRVNLTGLSGGTSPSVAASVMGTR